jgi:hypothetical protein
MANSRERELCTVRNINYDTNHENWILQRVDLHPFWAVEKIDVSKRVSLSLHYPNVNVFVETSPCRTSMANWTTIRKTQHKCTNVIFFVEKVHYVIR